MARLVRLAKLVALAFAVAATVALAPVRPTDAAPAAPQIVALTGPAVAIKSADVAPAVYRVLPAGSDSKAAASRRAGSTAVRAALTRVGAPYVWAAAGPDAFDCSGLVVWAFEQAGVTLPHSSQELAAGGQPVPLSQIRPGDVISYYSGASHVGIYVGGGKIVHSSTYGVPVGVAPMDNAPIYNVRRYM
jgi:cell wall-associated NlpC family hydrolase